MTLPQYDALAAYWRDHPPTHVLLGALLRPRRENKGDLAELLTQFGR